MNIEDLTIKQARELAALFGGGVSATATHPAVGKYCVVRTYSAGVHAGTLQAANGTAVTLTGSRRILNWTGALSCSEIAVSGIASGKVAVAVPTQYLTEAIEIIPATAEAEKCLRSK